MSAKKENKRPFFHPLALNSWGHWRKIRAIGGKVERGHKLRSLLVSWVSPLTAYLRMRQKSAYGKQLKELKTIKDPVFILGHWRTGTTHLHNLLATDPLIGWVTTYQTIMPESFLASQGWMKKRFAKMLPATRPMDNVKLGVDMPQEEEYAMCNFSPHSFYVSFYFPHKAPELFKKYVLMEGLKQEEIIEWRFQYYDTLKLATLACDNKRLVLKNPVNTARIKYLLELFPNAKFIHIYRDPYRVFQSTRHLLRSTFDTIAFQNVTDEQIEGYVLHFYREMMMKYLQTRDLIPKENLLEVKYEDLDVEPHNTMECIYTFLDYQRWIKARGRIAKYLETVPNYKKNKFTMTQRDIELVEQYWGFSLAEWPYPRPEVRE